MGASPTGQANYHIARKEVPDPGHVTNGVMKGVLLIGVSLFHALSECRDNSLELD